MFVRQGKTHFINVKSITHILIEKENMLMHYIDPSGKVMEIGFIIYGGIKNPELFMENLAKLVSTDKVVILNDVIAESGGSISDVSSDYRNTKSNGNVSEKPISRTL